jgi:hypothetical protein
VYLGPNNAVDVWEVKKLNHTEMVHLTEKPIELALRAMHYSSREGENVLDLFGGSGSTLAAAEQARRNAFLMELDPLYCDVIVKRWEELIGAQARHNRLPFPEIRRPGERLGSLWRAAVSFGTVVWSPKESEPGGAEGRRKRAGPGSSVAGFPGGA